MPKSSKKGSDFASLGLAAPLVATLSALSYEEPTPVQCEAIPLLLSGRDLLGQATTGTGKAAAFALPLIQRLLEDEAARRHQQLRPLHRELAEGVPEDALDGLAIGQREAQHQIGATGRPRPRLSPRIRRGSPSWPRSARDGMAGASASRALR